MSEQTEIATPAAAYPPGESAADHLEGRMSAFELVVTVLAFSAPVAVVSGYIPFVIIFNGAGAPSSYLVATLVLLVFSVGFTTMTRYLPVPGAFYSYVTAGLGRVAGLGGAFMAIFGYSCLLYSTAFAFFGVFADQLMVGTLHGPHIEWWVYGLVGWAAVGVLGYLNIGLSAKVLSVAMVLEVIVILVFDIFVFADGGPQGRSLQPFAWDTFNSGAVGVALLFAITCFLGFESTAIFREEVKNPRKTVPLATYVAVISIGIFYVVAAWLLVTAYGHGNVAEVAAKDPAGMFNAAMGKFVGSAGVDVVSVLMVTSIFAAMLSAQNVISRYYYNLAVDGVLPKSLGHSHPRFHSPYRASVLVTIIGVLANLVFIIRGSDPALLFGRWSAIGGTMIIALMFITSIAVFVYFRRSKVAGDANVFQTTIAPVVATAGMGTFTYLAFKNFDILLGTTGTLVWTLQVTCVAVLLVGMALALYLRAKKPEIYVHIGRK